ncbi:hypothetical protein [Rhodospirillum sp. A1_3_36]|uniref:hypothetical protein n=1 Tax=Rhodospirillum sp. A1_3_36 TaxID=3391666 RepID=UPI0039A6DE12
MVVAANQALHQARQMVERAAARAKEAVSQVMDRGARIMAELGKIDTKKLDEALQIRQAEKVLQERQKQQQKPKMASKKGNGPGFGMGF